MKTLVLSDESDPYLGETEGWGSGDGHGDGYGGGGGRGYGYGPDYGWSDGTGGIKQDEDSCTKR